MRSWFPQQLCSPPEHGDCGHSGPGPQLLTLGQTGSPWPDLAPSLPVPPPAILTRTLTPHAPPAILTRTLTPCAPPAILTRTLTPRAPSCHPVFPGGGSAFLHLSSKVK